MSMQLCAENGFKHRQAGRHPYSACLRGSRAGLGTLRLRPIPAPKGPLVWKHVLRTPAWSGGSPHSGVPAGQGPVKEWLASC